MLTSIQSSTLLSETFPDFDAVPTPQAQSHRICVTDLTTASEVSITVLPLFAGDLTTFTVANDRLKKLTHPNIQAYLGFWKDAQAPYLTDAQIIKTAHHPIARQPHLMQFRHLIAALDHTEGAEAGNLQANPFGIATAAPMHSVSTRKHSPRRPLAARAT